ncbi:hypothetical protein H1R20_g8006, partial [Candolleomyces eurysporus]
MSGNDLDLGLPQDATVDSNIQPIWNAQIETNDSVVNTGPGNGNLDLNFPGVDYGPQVGSSFDADIQGLSQFADEPEVSPGRAPELVPAPFTNATQPNSDPPVGGDFVFTDSLETWSPQSLQQLPVRQDSTLAATSSASAPLDDWQQAEMAGPSSAAPALDIANVPQAGPSAHLDLAVSAQETAVWQHSTLPANFSSSSASVNAQEAEVNYVLEGNDFTMPRAGPPAVPSLVEANPTQDDSSQPTQPHPAFELDPESLAGFDTFPFKTVAPSTMDQTFFGVSNNFDWMVPSVERLAATVLSSAPEMALPVTVNAQRPQLSQNPHTFLAPQPVVNGAENFGGSLSQMMAPPAVGNIRPPQVPGMGPSGYGAPTSNGSRMRALAPASMADTQLTQCRQFGPQTANGAHKPDSQSQTYPMVLNLVELLNMPNLS